MKYAVYNDKGDIVQEGTCPAKNVALQARSRPGCTSVPVSNEVTALTHSINPKSGKPQLLSTGEAKKRLDEYNAVAKPSKSKLERVLSFLKKKGLDLGPDGADL